MSFYFLKSSIPFWYTFNVTTNEKRYSEYPMFLSSYSVIKDDFYVSQFPFPTVHNDIKLSTAAR